MRAPTRIILIAQNCYEYWIGYIFIHFVGPAIRLSCHPFHFGLSIRRFFSFTLFVSLPLSNSAPADERKVFLQPVSSLVSALLQREARVCVSVRWWRFLFAEVCSLSHSRDWFYSAPADGLSALFCSQRSYSLCWQMWANRENETSVKVCSSFRIWFLLLNT